MGRKSPVPQKIVDYATKREMITVEDVMQDLNVSRVTARNYLSRLTKMDIVKRVGRGLYQRGEGTTVIIGLSPELSLLVQDLKKLFPLAKLVIWSINMLADYAHYAISRDLIVIETDKMLSDSIRDALVKKGYRAVVNPERRDFQEYAYYNEKLLFILERNETYGLSKLEDFFIPTPERIWVDIYYFITRKNLSFSPGELGQIFANMLRREGINFNRLLRYAQRRNLREEIMIFLYSLKQSSQFFIPYNILTGRKEALEIINEMVAGAKE